MAGALAILAILLIDPLAFGRAFPWKDVAVRVPVGQATRIRDQRAVLALERAPAGRPRVAVLGSSRGQAAFHPELIDPRERPPAAIGEFTHPGLHPFELRSLVGPITARHADVAVLIASEYETHRPLELRPNLTYASAAALVDLVSLGGVDFAIERRSEILQLFLNSVLNSYRTRSLLRDAGFTDVGHFRLPPRLEGVDENLVAFFGGERHEIPAQLRADVLAAVAQHLSKNVAFAAAVEMQQLRGLDRGENRRIQEALLRRSVQLLRAAGAEVILLEAPLFPPARALYDEQMREDFSSLGKALSEDSGVRFVPLEQGPEFAPGDFHDITHLSREGALKFTRWAFREIEGALARVRPSRDSLGRDR